MGSDELIVDRAGEQAEAVRSLRQAMTGTARVLLVEGHAGLGKSRLLRWLGGAATDLGARLVTGTALDGIDVPYLAWSGLAEVAPDAFGPAPDIPDDRRRSGVDAAPRAGDERGVRTRIASAARHRARRHAMG